MKSVVVRLVNGSAFNGKVEKVEWKASGLNPHAILQLLTEGKVMAEFMTESVVGWWWVPEPAK